MNKLTKYLKEVKQRAEAATDGNFTTYARQDVPILLETIKLLQNALNDIAHIGWKCEETGEIFKINPMQKAQETLIKAESLIPNEEDD